MDTERPRPGARTMRRIAALAAMAGLILFVMSFAAARDARADWGGASVDPACPGGGGLAGSCPSAYEGCYSWALFYDPQDPAVLSMTPFYDSNGGLAGY